MIMPAAVTCKCPPFLSNSSSSSSSSYHLKSSSSFHFHGFSSSRINILPLPLPKTKLSFRKRYNQTYLPIQPLMQMSLLIGKAQRWWEKGLHQNMQQITCAQHLANSLLNAGDQLVVLDFFSPACGGCKALHPKICQFAEMNPDVQFLQVNHEEHKSMCYTLNVHVLPFFRFYRGAHGRLCSFSCTNATIKKFRDALAKHTTQRCSLGPTKGLEEAELLALAANRDLSFDYTPTNPAPLLLEQPAPAYTKYPLPSKPIKEKTLVTATDS